MDEEAAQSQAVEEPLLPVSASKTGSDTFEIEPYQELFISSKKKQLSINVLRFAIFVDAVAGTIEQPNYPRMVLPKDQGGTEDSFPTTAPFDFSAATYFVPMAALLGVAISSLVIGGASDKYGRKPMMLICLYGTVVGCILKYVARGRLIRQSVVDTAHIILNFFCSRLAVRLSTHVVLPMPSPPGNFWTYNAFNFLNGLFSAR